MSPHFCKEKFLKTHTKKIILFVLATIGFSAPPLWAQMPVDQITGATLQLSAGDWTRVWLNGHQIAEVDPSTNEVNRGYLPVEFNAEQLGYFQPFNILAMEINHDIIHITDSTQLGSAYVLKVTFMDKTKKYYSSNEINHLNYLIEGPNAPEPDGWLDYSFDDGFWQAAQSVPPPRSVVRILTHPETHKQARYLYAFDVLEGNPGGKPGSRALFRRKFPPEPPPKTKTPTVTPTFTFTLRPTATPWPTATPRPRHTATFTPTPRPIPTPIPTATPIRRLELPPTPRYIPILIPTNTPTPIRRVIRRPPPQYMPPFIPSETPTPIRRKQPKPKFTPTFTATYTFTEVPARAVASSEAIVFVSPPVNIYVNFADGPGHYKMDLFDGQGHFVRTLFDRQVGYEKEMWLEWDGKNKNGQPMPVQHYFAYFSKEGKVLRTIELNWISSGQ